MRFTGMEELINTVQSDVVGRLAFKYMVRFWPFFTSFSFFLHYLIDETVCKHNVSSLHEHLKKYLSLMFVFFCQELCKVDSSSDSESDTNPRWSDVSSKVFLIRLTSDSSVALKTSDSIISHVRVVKAALRRTGKLLRNSRKTTSR